MNAPVHRRGAAPVVRLADFEGVERRAVLYLRLWAEGCDGRALVRNELAATLGANDAGSALGAFERLNEFCARHARRPIVWHYVDCACVGADEACLARFIATAAEGDREDAMLFALMMVRADLAADLVSLAQDTGLALRRIDLRTTRQTAASEARTAALGGGDRTLH